VSRDTLRQPLRVCYFGTYRANYSRNQIMIAGLRRAGVEVVECQAPLWQGIEDRVQAASGGWLRLAFALLVARAYWRLLRAYRRVGDYDVMMLGYPGQLDVYLARVLTWRRHKPLVLDVFMSLYLIASERGLTARHPTTGRLIYWLEKLAVRLPDLLILDTAEYVEWFDRVYGLKPARFRLAPTGADDRVFRPVEAARRDDGLFRVLYYGTFIPNHGVEHIIEAARLLRDRPDIRFELIGEGPTKSQAVALVEEYGLENVAFVDWLDKSALPRKAAEADVCLGVFGQTPQSMMTVQNKIYEGLALARPVITGDSPTVRAHLAHGATACLVERANPQALARAILVLRDDPALRERLARQGHRLFVQRFSIACIGDQTRRYLESLVSPEGNS
jgi:glycosyltransferase involved in cell wall biosynthesis